MKLNTKTLGLLGVVAATQVACTTAAPDMPVTFTVRVANVSTGDTLVASDNSMHAVPMAPGVYAVHASTVTAALFDVGQTDRGDGLEGLAEDGSAATLGGSLMANGALASSGVFDTPAGATDPGPIGPGGAYEFTITAMPGDVLTLATMFVQSNDLFFAPDEAGIALFGADGQPVMGDITGGFQLWDAGTEVNEEPGIGPNSAPLQAGPNTGTDENGTVRLISDVADGFTYPAVAEVLQVTVTPQ